LTPHSPRKTRKTAFTCALLAVLTPAPGFAAPAENAGSLPSCVPCHGMDGIGRDVEIPNLAGQNEAYLLNQLRAFRKGRRAHKEMLYMSRNLTDEDFKALAAYFAALPPR
jgi:cytochrome c553